MLPRCTPHTKPPRSRSGAGTPTPRRTPRRRTRDQLSGNVRIVIRPRKKRFPNGPRRFPSSSRRGIAFLNVQDSRNGLDSSITMDFALQNFQIDSVVVELGKFVCSLRHQLMNTTEKPIVISRRFGLPGLCFELSSGGADCRQIGLAVASTATTESILKFCSAKSIVIELSNPFLRS